MTKPDRKPTVLIVSQFFHPDHSAVSQIATDLAEDLAASGSEVTALASRGTYLGGRSLPREDSHAGVRIVRAFASSLGKRTLAHRAVDYGSFYVTASIALLRLRRRDVVVATTTPPLIAAAALLAKAFKGSAFVYWVQDLYPEVAVAFGALGPRSPLARVMGWVSAFIMRHADRVVVIGEEMGRRCVAAGARPDRVVLIPNWSDGRAVRPVDARENPLRASLAAGAETLVMYSGNMGRGHDVETLLEAARLLRARSDVRFLFIGDGAKRALVEAEARQAPNVALAPYQPRERLAESLSAGDVHLIALTPESEGLIEPSKLYGIMAAGRAALFVGPPRSEVARTIEREGCGVLVANGDAAALADAIRRLADDPTLREDMGRRARLALEERYTRLVATSRFERLLAELLAQRAAR